MLHHMNVMLLQLSMEVPMGIIGPIQAIDESIQQLVIDTGLLLHDDMYNKLIYHQIIWMVLFLHDLIIFHNYNR